jgi:HTH-type transcriptional regulator, competence development regulator
MFELKREPLGSLFYFICKVSILLIDLTIIEQVKNKLTMLGERLRRFRETKGLLQRQVAAKLEVDTAYISKVESDEKLVSRTHLKTLAKLFDTTENELTTLWLADKLYDVAKNEPVAQKAMQTALKELTRKEISKKK